jgi:molecular chaperone GrpE
MMTGDKPKPEDDIEYVPGPEPDRDGVPEPPEGEKGAVPASEAGAANAHPGGAHAEEAVRHLKDKLKKRDAEIRHLKKEHEELKDQYVRKLADMENLRKRLEREKTEYYQYALSDLLLELLSILDNFERALQTTGQEGDGKTFREGIELIYRMTLNLLRRSGVEPIEIKDAKFDPNLHHAMAMEESESVEEPEVTEVMQKGYLLHNRLLRPALVKVLVPKKAS